MSKQEKQPPVVPDLDLTLPTSGATTTPATPTPLPAPVQSAPPPTAQPSAQPVAIATPVPLPTEAKPTAIVPSAPAPQDNEASRALSPFADEASLSGAQRMAKALACSSLVPAAYQNNIPNVLIAMELANRIGASVLMIMQSLNVIHGRPSWDSKFLIATVNACGRFSPIRYKFQGQRGTDDWGCVAFAKDLRTGELCEGPLVDIRMAKDEGWFQKNGSKWKTIPQLMLMYRSAAFWSRVYAPELSLGIHTSDEVIDTVGVPVPDMPAQIAPGNNKSLEEALMNGQPSAMGEAQ